MRIRHGIWLSSTRKGSFAMRKSTSTPFLRMLRFYYLSRLQRRVREIEAEMEGLRAREGYSAGEYRELLEKQAEKQEVEKKIDSYKCYFVEPYFARIDVVDDKEGYNSYYIGKKGDVNLEIVDWRAPLPCGTTRSRASALPSTSTNTAPCCGGRSPSRTGASSPSATSISPCAIT